MCEHKDHEIATCEKLLETIRANGRCTYHDALVRAVATANGKLTVVLVIQSVLLIGAVAVVKGWL
jgi:hypothetical protein